MPLIGDIIRAINLGDKDQYRKLINSAKKDELMQYVGNGIFKKSALDVACECGDIDAIQLFLAKGIDVNTQTHSGLAPIHHIILISDAEKRRKALDFIIASGADVNLAIKDESKLTPLHLCATRVTKLGYDKTFVQLTNRNELRVNILDGKRLTAYDYFPTESHYREKLIQISAKQGTYFSLSSGNVRQYSDQRLTITDVRLVDPNQVRPRGEVVIDLNDNLNPKAPTPEQLAEAKEYEKAREAHEVANAETGETNFQLAIKANDKIKLALYMKLKFIPLVTDNALNTVYHSAAACGNKLLLEGLYNQFSTYNYNPYPDHFALQNKNGDTSLHVAISAGHVDCVVFLLEKGCSYNIDNNSGKTPLQLIQDNAALLTTLLKSNLSQKLKMVLEDKPIEQKKETTFFPGLFVPEQESNKVAAEVKILHSTITSGIQKAKKLTPMVDIILQKKTPEVLLRYANELNAMKNAPEIIKDLETHVRGIILEMEKVSGLKLG